MNAAIMNMVDPACQEPCVWAVDLAFQFHRTVELHPWENPNLISTAEFVEER